MQQISNVAEYNCENCLPGESYDYRDSTASPPYQFNVVPFQVENNLDFIDIYEDGTTLIGSSNITDKYWNGSIWSFKHADSAPAKEKCMTGFGFEYGVTCGKFFGSSQTVVIGDEGGGVSTVKFQELSHSMHCMPLDTSYCHDQAVTSLSVSKDSIYTVSSSTDSSIIIWENQNLNRVKKYCPAHGREVTNVSVSRFHSDLIFVSTSLDGSALMWDWRESKPAYCLKEDDTEPLSCADWKNENEIAIATNTGAIHLFDIRSHQLIHTRQLFDIPIVNIAFNKLGLLGVAGVWNNVIVWDFESNSCVYKDSRHNGRIRSLCWHPCDGNLYSCGDNKTVLRHEVDSNSIN